MKWVHRAEGLTMLRFLRHYWKPAINTLVAFTLIAGFPLAAAADPTLTKEVTTALQDGVTAWNAGDLPKFMHGYLDSPEVTFTSGGRILRGYAALQQRYQDTYGNDRQSMGQLQFDKIEVWPLGLENALALGHWHLEVAARRGRTKDQMEGVFSLVLKKTADGWKIIHDHTSRSADKPAPKT